VAFALTPGLPPIEHVTIRPRGNTITRILFVPQDYGKDGGSWHMLGVPGNEGNAVPPLEKPLTDLEKVYALLTPLYASRCALAVAGGVLGACWHLGGWMLSRRQSGADLWRVCCGGLLWACALALALSQPGCVVLKRSVGMAVHSQPAVHLKSWTYLPPPTLALPPCCRPACRACEEVLYGKGAASLSTSKEISKAGELARWIVMDSKLHPATRDERVSLNVRPGGEEDPTVKVRRRRHDTA
jgi:hypothetical protein